MEGNLRKNMPYGGVARKRIFFEIFIQNGIIIPPKYYGIHGIGDALLTVRIGEKDNWKDGLITQDGKVVLPAEYNRIISCSDNYYLCQRDGNCELLCVSNG